MNKRGQFYILTAVIFSVFIFGIVMTTNEVKVNRDAKEFYEYAENIAREIHAVQDSDLILGSGNNLSDFVNDLGVNLKDRDPTANFLVIYGNNVLLTIQNMGSENVVVNEKIIQGFHNLKTSEISISGTSLEVSQPFGNSKNQINITNLGTEKLNLTFDGKDYELDIPEYNITIILIQKENGEEKFIEIK